MKKKKDVFQTTIIAMLVAILIIQTFVPVLGYIPLGPLDVTIVHITVILSAVLFGSKTGLIIGAVWGILSMTRAYIQPTPFNVVFLNPLISVLPRLIVGWASGLLFEQLSKRISSTSKWIYSVTAFVGTAMNTILVLGGIYLLAGETYAAALGVPITTLLTALGGVFVSNGLIEIAASMIILPLVAVPLRKFVKRRNTHSI